MGRGGTRGPDRGQHGGYGRQCLDSSRERRGDSDYNDGWRKPERGRQRHQRSESGCYCQRGERWRWFFSPVDCEQHDEQRQRHHDREHLSAVYPGNAGSECGAVGRWDTHQQRKQYGDGGGKRVEHQPAAGLKGTGVALTVTPDSATVSSAINQFVTDYNTLIGQVNNEFTYTARQSASAPRWRETVRWRCCRTSCWERAVTRGEQWQRGRFDSGLAGYQHE